MFFLSLISTLVNTILLSQQKPHPPAASGQQYNFIEEHSLTDKFENITIIKKANVYFNGKVTSRTILFPDGTKKTLGFMMPGEYEFNTQSRELMEVLDGEMDVLLPGTHEWQTYSTGQSFEVRPDSSFKLKLNAPVDYCCSYE